MVTRVWIQQGTVLQLIPVAAEGFRRVVKLAMKLGCDVYVTSGREGDHAPDSWHYLDRAWDMQRSKFTRNDLLAALGEDWDVVEYEWGFHCEYDPK